jgi:DNA modification methylase
MSTIRWYTGDVFAEMAKLPDQSVDLVVTSPPFWKLRSYLPHDHKNKHLEIGSEPTPAAFLSTLLALTREWRRLLTPHGSLCVELGDTFAGSGGAGGDYSDNGWRDGQPRFGGSASVGRESRWSRADALWFAGVIDTEGSIMIHRQERKGAPSYRADICIAMMDRQVCDRAAEIAGVGNVNQDGRNVYTWHVTAQQARYVLTHIWPHLLIKQRQALAAIELQRHIEEHRGRGTYNPLASAELSYREMIREYVSGLNARGEERGQYVPTWSPPRPRLLDLPENRSIGAPLDKSLCGIPAAYQLSLTYGYNILDPDDEPFDPWRVRNKIVWHRPNPPVGALGDKVRPSTSYITVGCVARDRWFDLDAERTALADSPGNRYVRKVSTTDINGRSQAGTQSGSANKITANYDPTQSAGAPPLDCWIDGDVWTLPTHPYHGAHYATYPPALPRRLIRLMCPQSVCVQCGLPRRRIVDSETFKANGDPIVKSNYRGSNATQRTMTNYEHLLTDEATPSFQTVRTTLGWSDCGHNTWRRGHVLDPFAGSGTTGTAALDTGRDATLIDLDPRNLDLARERLGMFLEEPDGPKPITETTRHNSTGNPRFRVGYKHGNPNATGDRKNYGDNG